MRLLNTTTGKLVWFSDKEMRDLPYAILSHVWGESEQSFQDVSAIPPLPPLPWASLGPFSGLRNDRRFPAISSRLNPRLSPKIRGACMYALSLGFKWIWIDTCCIDKTSSAELSEAINSMFKWYAKATVCIAYLEDVRDPWVSDPPPDDGTLSLHSDLTESKWFDRGWTLQELVAPRVVEFVSRGWGLVGTKVGMAARLERRTRVDAAVLCSARALSDVCVADRMRWAAGRETTRVEDRAYSLLGIFGVNMPTLYGEGEAAFQRLQEAIMASSSDATLFMWSRQLSSRGLLAPGPENFLDALSLSIKPDDYLQARSLSVIPVEQIPASVDAFLGALNARTPSTQKFSGQLPPDTPSLTKTSHGVRAWIPLIRCARHHESAIAVMAAQCEDQYQGLALQRAATTRTLHHYTVARTIAPSTLSEFWTVWDGDKYSVEWTDIYITDAVLSGNRRNQFPLMLDIPPWVLARMSRHYGFFLYDDMRDNPCQGLSPISLVSTRVDILWAIGWPSSRTLTFTSVDTESQEKETLQVEFNIPGQAQSGAALVGFDIRAVTMNGRKAEIFPGPASTGHGDGTLWFGDQNRAVGFTPLSNQSELDITLSGTVYERYGQIYGARWRVPSPTMDDGVHPPGPRSKVTEGDLNEVRRMISDAMEPLRAELATVVTRLAAAEAEIARLKGEQPAAVDEGDPPEEARRGRARKRRRGRGGRS